jgi:hypothetical protein
MPTVERLNVEISANIPQLSASMKHAEAVVDQSARRMQRVRSRWAVGAGSETRSILLGGLTAVSAMMAVGRALNAYQPGSLSQPYGGKASGAGDAILDWTDALAKSIPVLGDFYEAGKKLSASMFDDAADIDLKRFGASNIMRERLSLQAQSLSPDEAVRIEAKRRIARVEAQAELEARREEIAKIGGPQSLQNMLVSAAEELFRAQLAKADRDAQAALDKIKPAAAGYGGTDTFGTVHGAFKVGQLRASDVALSDVKRSTAETATQAKKIASAVERIAGSFGAFV